MDILRLILNTLPRGLLLEFLRLKGDPLTCGYSDFTNLILYSTGAGGIDVSSGINVLNELITEITAPLLENLDSNALTITLLKYYNC